MAKKTASEKTDKPKRASKKKEVTLRLEDVLMNCRNIMRGKASMTVRRDIILTLVFLKFLDQRFQEQREKIISQYKDQPKFLNLVMERENAYQQEGVSYLETDCRWDTILMLDGATRALDLDNIINKLNQNDRLRGALPAKIFTDSKIESNVIKQLAEEIDKIGDYRFTEKDLIGRVYEYFLQAFSINADKEEGEFYTPHSIVETIASLIEPYNGIIYDPCCGSGGMFVQSAKFIASHNGDTKKITVYGQESNPDTYRLAKMNLAIRGISYNLGEEPASTFTSEKHKDLKADYIMANPPFNLKKWRGEGELTTDRRWAGYGVPPVSNANYAWILHMLYHLNPSRGIAGFLLANGALGDPDTVEIRQRLIENDKIEAIIVLPREMFYSTDISVTLWILNNNKRGGTWHDRQLRDRTGEVLFVDLRTWNQNIYEKKYVQLVPEQIQQLVRIYQKWQSIDTKPNQFAQPELYRSVSIDEIETNGWSLVPSRYIEFVDRDTNLDYEAILAKASEKTSELISRQQKNQDALSKAFAALGYKA